MKPEQWAAIKALNRAAKERNPLRKGAFIDKRLMENGKAPLFGTRETPQRSRKPARRARITKGGNE